MHSALLASKVQVIAKDETGRDVPFGTKTLTKEFKNKQGKKYRIAIQEPNQSRVDVGEYTVQGGMIPPNQPPTVDAGQDLKVDIGTKGILLDGTVADPDGRVVRALWTQTHGPTVTLVPDPIDFTNAKFDAPDIQSSLMFQLEAEDDAANITRDFTIVTVGDIIIIPPQPGNYPIQNIKWLYSSDEALSHDGDFPTKKRSPFDPILLFSNASGCKFHTIKNKWLIVRSADGNGRVYWEYYELDEWKAPNSKLGFVTILTASLRFNKLGGDKDHSVKDGNHGTTGYDFDGETEFGGFGFSITEIEITSKVEGRHGVYNGDSVKAEHPSGIKLKVGEIYKFFAVWAADQQKNECVLNVWMDYGDGQWTHTMKDRTWKAGSSDWNNVINSMSESAKDFAEVKKGPGFVRRHHVWDRANDFDDDIQGLKIGTTT